MCGVCVCVVCCVVCVYFFKRQKLGALGMSLPHARQHSPDIPHEAIDGSEERAKALAHGAPDGC